MFTTADKAIVALVMGGLSLLQIGFGITVPGLTPDTVTAIVGFITPILVYFIPNKKA